jgi:HlyD family secretion protein
VDRLNLVGTEGRTTVARRIAEASHSTLHVTAAGRKLIVLGASLLMLAVGTLWWATRPPAQPAYRVATVTSGTVSRAVTATGTVNPVLTIIIGSYVSGVISSMYCDYNTRVKKGQLCAKIDPRPYQAALDQAKGQLARDSAQLQGARVNLARYAELKDQDSIARQTYEDQVALVHQLEGSVQLDRAAVETAQVNLGYTNIVSPVDGTVVARNITIGQTVAASFQTPTLFLIAMDLTKMQVDTNVSESDIGAIKEGDPATFTVEAFTDRTFQGTVVQVRQAPQTVQNVVTYDVVVGADNGQFLLKPGMTATVSIVTDRREQVLRVPNQALRFSPGGLGTVQPGPSQAASSAGGKAQVWILRSGKPVAVSITAGLADDTYTEVRTGDLRAGDQVVIGEQRVTGGSQTRGLHFGF